VSSFATPQTPIVLISFLPWTWPGNTQVPVMSNRERPTQRSACNRCHSQKLRCIRGTLPNDSCQRCTKAKETCQSSPPLRLGRRANRPGVENGPENDSAASSGQSGSTRGTDGPERQLEEDSSVNFTQLGFYGGDTAQSVQEDAHGTLISFCVYAKGQTAHCYPVARRILIFILSKLSSWRSTSSLKNTTH